MLFNSIEFAIFLPVVFLLYWFVFGRNLRLQNLFVVVASYVFYGWWDWRFLLLIAFTSLCSWGSGMIMENLSDRKGLEEDVVIKRKQKAVTAANIIVNLLILCIFKYYDFFVSEFARLFHITSESLLLKFILPVGISFYTFQALSYSIDVYRGKIAPTKDIVAFFAYVSFFPQLVAGPIERATNLLPQFERERSFNYDTAVDGCRHYGGFLKRWWWLIIVHCMWTRFFPHTRRIAEAHCCLRPSSFLSRFMGTSLDTVILLLVHPNCLVSV